MKRSGQATRPGPGGQHNLSTRFSSFSIQHSTLSYLAEPPSFSSVSNPHVVVMLKNVLKKDSTTKGRALEELIGYVQEVKEEVEDALLDVWVQVYPRISIDNARRVRELSHNLQLELLKSGRKRMERRLSAIVASWVAGSFDRDRVVARAANVGLTSFLDTPEKLKAFWLKCQSQILAYAIEAIRETPDTLSDERTTTAEDADAKYYRVIYAALCLGAGLLQKVPADSLSTFQAQYEEYLRDDIWGLIEARDPSVRKALCNLMLICLDRDLLYVDTKLTRLTFVTGGLRASHAGTALEYVQALTKLTNLKPEIWNAVEGKKSPFSRLCLFIAKGSQGSPPKFWEQLDSLLQVLPCAAEGHVTFEHASELIGSILSGISNREEPRTNTAFAWKCYIDTAKRLLPRLPATDQLRFATDKLFPLFERFLFSPPESKVAIPLGPNAMGIFVEAHNALAKSSAETRTALINEWDKLAATFCTNIAGVLPEVSKEFRPSQDGISEEGRRWFGLIGELHRADVDGSGPSSIVAEPSAKVITQCFQLLKNRNLKPYGVARILEFALSNSNHLFEGDLGSQCVDFLSSVPGNDMQLMVDSHSAASLISSLHLMRVTSTHGPMASEVWNAWIKLILEKPPSASRTKAITSMISSTDLAGRVQESSALQSEILRQTCQESRETTPNWDLLDAAIQHHALNAPTFNAIAVELLQSIDEDKASLLSTLTALEKLVEAGPSTFVENESLNTALIRHLIGLKDAQDTNVSSKASKIRSILDKGSGITLLPIVNLIQQNLDSAGPQCLSIELLAQQAHDALEAGASSVDIFPSTNSFIRSFAPFLERTINPSMAIMNLTGDILLFVSPSEGPGMRRPPARDSKGRSIPVRMALYVCHLLNNGQKLSTLPEKFQIELLYLQALVAQMVSDDISLNTHDGLWLSLDSHESLSQAEWLVSTSRRHFLALTESCTDWSVSAEAQSNIMPQVVDFLAKQATNLTPTALHSSRVLGDVFQSVVEKSGIPTQWEQDFLGGDALKAVPEKAALAASVLSGMSIVLRPVKSVNTFCNRLVSEIAGAKAPTERSAIVLSLMTLCGSVYDAGALPIPSNRVVFAVKQITDWFEDGPELSPEFATACLRCLGQLLPCIQEVYGSFWEKTLQYCVKSWEKARQHSLSSILPLLHASLKLTKSLEEIEDMNDDLTEALTVFAKQKGPALVDLLRLDRDGHSQPSDIVDRLLCREVDKLSTGQLPEPEELYGLVASDSEIVQTAAFTMLHRMIPEQQPQKSVGLLLDKIDARLPDELLSLLLDAPTLEQYSDEVLATFPLSVRGYLLSWKLIFDTYAASPFTIRMGLTDGLEDDNIVNPLLDFMFDVLGHSAGYPLKLDKEQITRAHIRDFDIKQADAESEEKSMHWLLSHLFYLTLKYLPGLFRRWFQDCRSKQTKMAVESWTETFFSPLVVEDALDDVQTWVDGTEFDAPGEAEVVVKVSKSGKEIFVSYEIDESQGGLSIKLPNNFPVDGVTVKGTRRVAVDERKWQNWIMTTQGVITFSNSNIINGIQAFRRNLTGALQGHTECAICYSVISSDQRVPEKNCSQCKNLFHRLCLYKWFQTSNNNTCPLCRTPINFAGASGLKRRKREEL
ncbi:hypothetical protein NLU13_5864 [Sarocladium strictum]|uniref:E3 ubiquitin-protein ligase listerin n=1 Tax=Sarocladium strictum TaxID=5046 RepID=A0AA39L6L2_SARSR|nr:hypothetical protein NLU13_5864 [Sarocladium strictum]